MNPAVGVLTPAPGRPCAQRFRRFDTADRIRFPLLRRGLGPQTTAELVVPLAVLSLVSAAGTAAAPALWGSPLLLIALSPRLPFLMFAAPRTGLVLFVVLGTVRLCLADPFHYRLGRRLATRPEPGRRRRGPARRRGGGRSARLLGCRWARLLGHRWARPAAATAVLLRPNGRHLALAGAVGLPVTVVAALDLAGTALYLAGIHGAAALLA